MLSELRNANNDILENQDDIDCLRDSESFRKHYATVLVQLKEASGQACGFHRLLFYYKIFFCLKVTFDCYFHFQVSSALLQLRQRNTYTGNSLPPWMKTQASFNVHEDLPYSSLAPELGSTVIEIIKGSRLRAHAMAIAAVKV